MTCAPSPPPKPVGFHHHATLSIAAYGFLVSERLATGAPDGVKKLRRSPSPCASRGLPPARQPSAHSGMSRTQSPQSPPAQLSVDQTPRTMSLLRAKKQKSILGTQ